MRRPVVVFVLIVGFLLMPVENGLQKLVYACTHVSASNFRISVADEEAAIFYDSRTKTERFIRQARFESDNPDFGILVPTPGLPTLTEVQPTLFKELEKIASERRYVDIYVREGEMPAATSTVENMHVAVLTRKRVGDFDAVIVKADDANALLHWLEIHRYKVRPAVRAWLEPYIKNGWFITALKVVTKPESHHGKESAFAQSPELSPVCITFQTPVPFYPYREASDSVSASGRLLRIFYFGDTRVNGTYDEKGMEFWGASTTMSKALTLRQKESITRVPGMVRSIGDRLTVLEDHSQRRKPSDLYFIPTSDQSDILPVERIYHQVDKESIGRIASSLFGVFTLLFSGLFWARKVKDTKRRRMPFYFDGK